MYNYIALRINSNPCDENITDLLAAFLADEGYETFESDNTGTTAYIRSDKFSQESVETIIRDFPIPAALSFSFDEIEGEDWNKEWEQNYFQPILIDNSLVIHSSFHENYPHADIDILIDPKMAFGTGHHATTSGMARLLLKNSPEGKDVIDMGTGTGILAILAKKLGAKKVTGIDIDEFAIENAKENGALNREDITWIIGDDRALGSLTQADILLANINLNVIKDNIDNYLAKIKPGGLIFLSGFLESDVHQILELAQKRGLNHIDSIHDSNWVAMAFSTPKYV